MAFHSYIAAAGFHTRVDAIEAIHFVVAVWKTKSAESRGHENDNSRINQFNEPLALPVVPSKWLLDRQSFEIRTGSMCG